MKIRKSSEDYLEMILMVKEKKGIVRSVDIAAGLEVSKPSVSVAMKNLQKDGYLLMDENRHITLTDKGMAIAANIYERHKVLTRFFEALGVNGDVAREDACKVEHDLSAETFEAIRACQLQMEKEKR